MSRCDCHRVRRGCGRLLPRTRRVLLGVSDMPVTMGSSLGGCLSDGRRTHLFGSLPISFICNGLENTTLRCPSGRNSFVILMVTGGACKCRVRGRVLLLTMFLLLVDYNLVCLLKEVCTGHVLHPLRRVLGRLGHVHKGGLGMQVGAFSGGSRLSRLVEALGRVLSEVSATFRTRGSFVDGTSRRLGGPLATVRKRYRVDLLGRHSTARCVSSLRHVSARDGHVARLVGRLLFLSHRSRSVLRGTGRGVSLIILLHSLYLRCPRIAFGAGRASKDIRVATGFCLLHVTLRGVVSGTQGCSGRRMSIDLDVHRSYPIVRMGSCKVNVPRGRVRRVFRSFCQTDGAHRCAKRKVKLDLSVGVLSICNNGVAVSSRMGYCAGMAVAFPRVQGRGWGPRVQPAAPCTSYVASYKWPRVSEVHVTLHSIAKPSFDLWSGSDAPSSALSRG